MGGWGSGAAPAGRLCPPLAWRLGGAGEAFSGAQGMGAVSGDRRSSGAGRAGPPGVRPPTSYKKKVEIQAEGALPGSVPRIVCFFCVGAPEPQPGSGSLRPWGLLAPLLCVRVVAGGGGWGCVPLIVITCGWNTVAE